MDIIVLSIFILSVVVYYIYAKLRTKENRILIKFQVVQLLIEKEEPAQNWNMLVGTQYHYSKHWEFRVEVGF